MTGPYTLPRFMRKPDPLPGRGCRGCAGSGPFRDETAEVCLDCDQAQQQWRKEYARNYGLIRSRALAALRDRHPLEYADLLAQMRLGCDRPMEPPIPEAYFPDHTLLIKLAAQRHSQPPRKRRPKPSAAQRPQ